jgi:hypothetical protein
MANNFICKIEGCGKPRKGRGWCSQHWQRWRKYGDPLAARPKALDGEPDRFFREVVLVYDGEDCLLWPYGRDGWGYGRIWIDGRTHNVHRLACEMEHGLPSDARLEAAHSCGNGHLACVNRKHVRWATPKENSADKFVHGTMYRGGNKPRG